jgi:hypothetical protein
MSGMEKGNSLSDKTDSMVESIKSAVKITASVVAKINSAVKSVYAPVGNTVRLRDKEKSPADKI